MVEIFIICESLVKNPRERRTLGSGFEALLPLEPDTRGGVQRGGSVAAYRTGQHIYPTAMERQDVLEWLESCKLSRPADLRRNLEAALSDGVLVVSRNCSVSQERERGELVGLLTNSASTVPPLHPFGQRLGSAFWSMCSLRCLLR